MAQFLLHQIQIFVRGCPCGTSRSYPKRRNIWNYGGETVQG